MNEKTMRYAIGLVALWAATSAFAQNRYALGPVEFSNSKTEIVVLGQQFAIDGATRCTLSSRVVSKQRCMAALTRNTYVVVEGDIVQIGRAATIVILPFAYIPGASTVMLGGRVTATDPSVGVVSLGSLRVDESGLFAEGPIVHPIGQYLEVAGTQPLPNGALVADGVRFSSLEAGARSEAIQTVVGAGSQAPTAAGILTFTDIGTQAITGTGIQAITGTGTQAITGTGTQAITGTGAQAITGTGTQAITGTGTQAITGTGTQAITGTGTQAITGTGTQAITGTGTQAITGTGIRAITGAGTQAITGTGTQASTGTGSRETASSSTQAITGTGAL